MPSLVLMTLVNFRHRKPTLFSTRGAMGFRMGLSDDFLYVCPAAGLKILRQSCTDIVPHRLLRLSSLGSRHLLDSYVKSL